MPTVSIQIKQKLLDYAKSIFTNAARSTLLPHDQPAGSLGRGYAAILLSIINYGYNVANRAEIKSEKHDSSDELKWIESGIDLGIDNFGHYIRSENGHPSREVYSSLITLLLSYSGELVNLSKHATSLKNNHTLYLQTTLNENSAGLEPSNFYRALNGLVSPIKNKGKKNINYDAQSAIEQVEYWDWCKNIIICCDKIIVSTKVIKTKLETYKSTQLEEYLQEKDSVDDSIYQNLAHIKESWCELGSMLTSEAESPFKLTDDDACELRENINSVKIKCDLIQAFVNADLKESLESKGLVGKKSYWLGQWKSPEDVIEDLFSKLTLKNISLISYSLIETEFQRLDDRKFEEPMTKVDATHQTVYSLNQQGCFPEIMKKRLEITRNIAKNMQSIKNTAISVEAPETDYPCVIFDLRNYIDFLGSKIVKPDEEFESAFSIDDTKEPSSVITALNNILLSYFSGIVNRISEEKYGKEQYIMLQAQGSFGSLRPSITDTGYSFRLSPGLVPDSYQTFLTLAFSKLNDDLICDKNTSSLLEALRQEFFFRKANKINLQSDVSLTKHNYVRLEIANLSKSGVSLEVICNTLKTPEDQILTVTPQRLQRVNLTASPLSISSPKTPSTPVRSDTPGTPNSSAGSTCSSLSRASSTPSTPKSTGLQGIQKRLSNCFVDNLPSTEPTQTIYSTAPVQLLSMLNNLTYIYRAHKNTFPCQNKSEGVNFLLGNISELDEIIDWVLADQKSESFSIVATKVESLFRLLQLRYEFEILSKRTLTIWTEMANITADTVMTTESNNLALPMRSGMSALTKAILIISEAYTEKHLQHNILEISFSDLDSSTSEKSQSGLTQSICSIKMDEVYFEIDCDTPADILQIFKRPASYMLPNESSPTPNVLLIDNAQFPRGQTNQSKKTCWAKSWGNINSADRPDILLVDITSGGQTDLDYLLSEFEQDPTNKPAAMILFSSENKYGQGGVDLTSMGELRLITKKNSDRYPDAIPQLLKIKFQQAVENQEENNTAAKAYRKLLRDVGLRRTTKHPANQTRSVLSDITNGQQVLARPCLFSKPPRNMPSPGLSPIKPIGADQMDPLSPEPIPFLMLSSTLSSPESSPTKCNGQDLVDHLSLSLASLSYA